MKRREFITLVGSAAAIWPLPARAQQSVAVIGYLGGGSAKLYAELLRGLRQGLTEIGYVEGQNLVIEYRWAEGQNDRLPALATDLVRTIESLIAEAEAARAKAMSEKGGAAAAVSALTAKAKLAGMWREKVDQHNTGNPVYERIERVIVERPPQSAPGIIPDESSYDEPSTEVAREMPSRHWSAD